MVELSKVLAGTDHNRRYLPAILFAQIGLEVENRRWMAAGHFGRASRSSLTHSVGLRPVVSITRC